MGAFTNKRIQPDAVFMNPASAQALGLLGVGDFEFSQSRGLRLGSREARQNVRSGVGSSNNIFTPESMAAISNYLTGGAKNQFQTMDSPEVAGMVRPALERAQEVFSSEIDPALVNLVNTGFRTDTAGLRAGAMRGFKSESLPQAFEQLSAYGVGLGSSGAQETVGRLAADLEAELMGYEFAADEAAAGRRVQGIPMANQLFNSQGLSNLLGAQSLLEYGNQLESSDRGAGLFNALQALTSLAQGNGAQPMLFGRAPSDAQQVTELIGNSMSGVGMAAGGNAGSMMGSMGGMGGMG